MPTAYIQNAVFSFLSIFVLIHTMFGDLHSAFAGTFVGKHENPMHYGRNDIEFDMYCESFPLPAKMPTYFSW